MKSQILMFLQQVLNELGTWCGVSTLFDLKTIEERVEHEGISYLTITLTQFGKDLEQALERGYVDSDLFQGYTRQKLGKGRGTLPEFLGGFMSQVFDREDGTRLDSPNVQAVRALRQITLMWGKIELPTSTKREEAAFEQYVDVDIHVKSWERSAYLGASFLGSTTMSYLVPGLSYGLSFSLQLIKGSSVVILFLSTGPARRLRGYPVMENTSSPNGQTDLNIYSQPGSIYSAHSHSL